MNETGTSAWKVAFFESLQAWYGGGQAVQSLDFASEGEAVIWARTQEMGRFRLAAITQGNLLRALYLEPPPDPLLMRQERVEIPAVAPAH
ncbi:hypothetical protein CEW83_13860 [Parazoarcus communis]|uniref:Uncharacterized protein n=1 Tax=Parazoarcus communis TaxID=41977 RepID=A0A2U8GSG9_9RHOO|nr:hypothetical protein [Parazoarcus communis]AWI76173.1 hypothetical protein CEW83_13860 [Parazoarcus communis]